MSGSSRAVAISCFDVAKSFALVDQGNAWRLAFGGMSGVAKYEALRDVSLTIPKGEFVGVLGRNGAGKSTLLRVLGGVYAADRGSVSVRGALSGLYELGLVGNVELTGRLYAERLLTVHGFSKQERAVMVADVHDFSELGDRFDDPIVTYSAGMTARLFFATATAGYYEVYLLDEILSVGDQHFQAKCWRRLRDRVGRGASGVLVTHDWSAIMRLCRTAHVLVDGRVVASGPSERAVRFYLWGESAQQAMKGGTARFVAKPADDIRVSWGGDLTVEVEVEIMAQAAGTVGLVYVIERLQPGYGWETSIMSREPSPIGDRPGLYAVEVALAPLPLEAGSYQLSLHVVMADPEIPSRRIVLDGFGWLDGNGIGLQVDGPEDRGLHLPVNGRWLSAAEVATTATSAGASPQTGRSGCTA